MNTMGAMNRTEQKLVEDHIYLIRPILLNTVRMNETVQGLGYEDLYQTACAALCRAAMEYRSDKGAAFPTFASAVIRNSLLSSCRYAARIQGSLVYLDAPVNGEDDLTYAQLLADERQKSPDGDDSFVLSLLRDAESRYSGCTRKGIQALHLKCQGHSNKEIAAYYGVKSNLVAAWISKAAARLRNDKQFVRLLRA